jgi:hypothetical protein
MRLYWLIQARRKSQIVKNRPDSNAVMIAASPSITILINVQFLTDFLTIKEIMPGKKVILPCGS